MGKILTILLSLILHSNLAFSCFSVDGNALREEGRNTLFKYRSLFESLLSIQKDHITYLQNESFNGMPKTHNRAQLIMHLRGVHKKDAISAETVLADYEQIAAYLTVFVDYALSNIVTEEQLFQSLENVRTLDEKFIFSLERLREQIEASRELLGQTGYRGAHLDHALNQILTTFTNHYVPDSERYASSSTLTPEVARTADAGVRYADKVFRRSGFLETLSLLKELQQELKSHGTKFALCRFCHLPATKNKVKQRRAISSLNRDLPEEPLPCHAASSEDLKEVTAAVELSSLAEGQTEEVSIKQEIAIEEEITIGEEVGVEEECDLETPLGDYRWWLGYELEKKHARIRMQQEAKMSVREENVAAPVTTSTKEVPIDDELMVESILQRFANIANFNCLEDILRPGRKKLTELSWSKQVAPLLVNLGAMVDSRANGSRNTVELNGLSSVFHTHGRIYQDTIYRHLRNFILQSLNR